jgi:XTP/dITP diphosphohydrolase
MPLLVVGTKNAKKRLELLEILGGLGIDLRDLTSYPAAPDVIEDRDSFAGNAAKKATELALALNEWVLGEDSGLCVPALGGQPGVLSARYAADHDDEANNDKLLAEIAKLPLKPPAAYYVCHSVLSSPTGEVKASVEGRCYGVIIHERRGQGGFGYDPLFLVPEYHKTFGELSSRVKHALSHRGRAMLQLRPILRQLFATRES